MTINLQNIFFLAFMFLILLCCSCFPSNDYDSIKDKTLKKSSVATKTVEAIYKYKNSIGIWPMQVSDLVPEFLHKNDTPPDEWKYLWNGYDVTRGPMLRMRGALHISLFYNFPSEDKSAAAGWLATMEGDPIEVIVQQNIPKSENVNTKEILYRSIAELKRRIKNENDSRIKKLHEEQLKKVDISQ